MLLNKSNLSNTHQFTYNLPLSRIGILYLHNTTSPSLQLQMQWRTGLRSPTQPASPKLKLPSSELPVRKSSTC